MSYAAHDPPGSMTPDELIRRMETLRLEVLESGARNRALLLELPPGRRPSAQNLLHYLALRSNDLRQLQNQLAGFGLSSLGRLEQHVLATINIVLRNLYLISGQQPPADETTAGEAIIEMESDRLESNTAGLLGPLPGKRRGRIIVTMPSEAASDYMMVHRLLESGMNCMRINCSHDDPSAWSQMADHLRNARRATGVPCSILMDLGGPKLRTGPMEPLPPVLKIRPGRGPDGKVLRPARIWLSPSNAPPQGMDAADASLVLDARWLAKLETGDKLSLRDARSANRTWRIREITADGCWAESKKTCYLNNGTVLCLQGKGGTRTTIVEGILAKDGHINVRKGDVLHLSNTDEPGRAAIHDAFGELLNPGQVSIPVPEIYRDVRPGDKVCFDDGRISGIVEKTLANTLHIRIVQTHKATEKLTGDRGVNFPDSRLDLPALSEADLVDLEFAARHADIVGLSFTNSADDVRALRKHLQELGAEQMGVVVKIETKRGFANLPGILLAALKFPACGVMIARGDLAVECGFERMAEMQEEILWVCESAHVPVIWATQVLEGLSKRGHASRAEITDAAMSQAADAVMLNKGPYVTDAVRALDDILQRMQGHHSKKQCMLRELQIASNFSHSSG